jgi:glycosidase
LKNEQEKTKLLHLFQLTVRGVPCVYYGEEIGMEDLKIPYKKGLDPVAQKYKGVPRFITEMKNETLNRDDLRTPMQWSDKKNAGFSTSDSTWLPVNSNFTSTNVETQMSDSTSMLHHFKSLLKIRNENEAFQSGALELIKTNISENILCYKRILNDKSYTVLINFSKKKIELPDNFLQGKMIYQLENSNQQNLQAWGAIVVEDWR